MIEAFKHILTVPNNLDGGLLSSDLEAFNNIELKRKDFLNLLNEAVNLDESNVDLILSAFLLGHSLGGTNPKTSPSAKRLHSQIKNLESSLKDRGRKSHYAPWFAELTEYVHKYISNKDDGCTMKAVREEIESDLNISVPNNTFARWVNHLENGKPIFSLQ